MKSLSIIYDGHLYRDGQVTIPLVTPAGGAVWGAITGTLSTQTDLDTALAAKEATASKGATSGYCGLDGSAKVAIANLPTGTSSTTVCIGNDARLTDNRLPTRLTGAYAAGTFSVATGNYAIMANQLTLTSTQTLTLSGTACLRII